MKYQKKLQRLKKETAAAQEQKFGHRQVEKGSKDPTWENEENKERRSSDTRKLSTPR